MSKPKGKFMDVLQAGLADDDEDGSGSSPSSSSQEADSGDEAAAEKGPVQKKVRKEITVEDLQKAGYKSGPSVLYMKPPQDQQPTDWNWSNGREAKEQEGSEDEEERAATRAAVTKGVETSAVLAVKAMEHASKLRDDSRTERAMLAAERKKESFNTKEKRKRDLGQASRAKNFVEESKRQAREFGVYSGFD